jgi:hypothetical protein
MVEKINKNLCEKSRFLFKEIKKRIENEKYKPNIIEFEKAIQKLVEEYNTANWENRFVVGGALEIIFCALLRSLDFRCKWLKEARYDIEVNEIKFSLKSNFVGGGGIRLINILGDEKAVWEEPTLFFISKIGICYADPQMKLKTKHTSDALVIETKELKKLIKNHNEWLIPLSIPQKQKNSKEIKTASYDVAKSILEEINSQYLRKYITEI